MKVKAIAPWFGSKRILAKDIVVEIGRPKQFFDLMCGSIAVPMVMEPCHHETINDMHTDVIGLARVVADPDLAPRLYNRLMGTVCSEDMLRQARTVIESGSVALPEIGATEEMCDRAYWYFVAAWLSRNGCAGQERTSFQMAVRWTPGGGASAKRFRNTVESIPWWHRRLLNMSILNRDAFPLISKVEDAPHTAMYFDPPYIAQTRTGMGTGGNGSRYLHDFLCRECEFEPSDMFPEICRFCGNPEEEHVDHHERLAEMLCEFKHARIVVSYYDCDRVRELYDGWNFVVKTRRKHLYQQNRRGAGKQDAPEVLIINGPSYAKE